MSIIDVAGGAQPLANEDGSVVTIFNGEIWNYAALRADLIGLGHRFRTACDTEVLVHGYEEWKQELLGRLDGMFAFAIWDAVRESLLIARDPLGKKPLYFTVSADSLAFASDVRTLNVVRDARAQMNAEAIASFLFQRYATGETSMFRDVKRLRPGHAMIFSQAATTSISYWQPPTSPTTVDLAPHELRDILTRAVEKRLMSDVPIGIFLSGGLDSAVILALTRECSDRVQTTYTAGFADPRFDERPGARATAAFYGANVREVVIAPLNYLDCLPRLAWYRDEPIAEPAEIPLFLLAEFASREVKVVLSGEGSDELFGGYPKYRAERLLRLPGSLPRRALQLALRASSGRRPARETLRAMDVLAIQDEPFRWASWFRSFSPQEIQALVTRDLQESATAEALSVPLMRELAPYHALDPGRRMQTGDVLTYLTDNLLARADRVLMGASLEGRFPLLDKELVNRALRLPISRKAGYVRSKKVLRSTLTEVMPPEMLARPKRGFPVPIASMLLSTQPRFVDDLLLSDRALDRGIFDTRALRRFIAEAHGDISGTALKLFTLVSLELWLRTNIDQSGEIRPAVAA